MLLYGSVKFFFPWKFRKLGNFWKFSSYFY